MGGLERIVIVGASMAGLRAAEELRGKVEEAVRRCPKQAISIEG